VTVAFGLRNIAETDRGLAEMARVCKPGGRLAILEFSLPKNWLSEKAIYGISETSYRGLETALPTTIPTPTPT